MAKSLRLWLSGGQQSNPISIHYGQKIQADSGLPIELLTYICKIRVRVQPIEINSPITHDKCSGVLARLSCVVTSRGHRQ